MIDGFLDSLGEVLHGLFDAVSGLGADRMQKCNATQIFLSRETEEVRKGLSRTRVSGVVLVGKKPAARPALPAAGPVETADGKPGVSMSRRETEVLELITKGFTYEEIARKLGVTRHTVQTFVRRIYAKLEVGSKIEAINAARQQGLLGP